MLRRIGAVFVVLAIAGGVAFYATREGPRGTDTPGGRRTFASNDPVERACALPKEQLVRLWRGHHPVHSEDVTIVPLEPNYSGAFSVTSHSGPWDYVQTVPLVFYGPEHVPSEGVVERAVTLADVSPTVRRAAMPGTEAPGETDTLDEALPGSDAAPRLIVTLVWDGVGRNVLDRWPDAWPNLERLEAEGTSYLAATVGSSPSITPATHSTLGTGAFPNRHGVTAIEYRERDGTVRGAFQDRDPSDLELPTFADEIDLAYGNASLAGLVAWKSWHLGMLGHGAALDGGDKDHLALIGGTGDITGNGAFYETPGYLDGGRARLERHAQDVDRSDGEADGEWMGHPVLDEHDNPAWVDHETEALLTLIDREGYGRDEVPDLLFVNYKPTDIVAHRSGMTSPEMEGVLQAQDAALGRLIEHLEDTVKDYVVIVTADHGNTLPARESGAWPVQQGQLQEDVDAHFDIAPGESLIRQTSAAGPFLNRKLAAREGVSAADIARFLNGYTIRENWDEGALPEGYEDRGGENVLAAAFTSKQYPRVMRCAFGAAEPPEGFGG